MRLLILHNSRRIQMIQDIKAKMGQVGGAVGDTLKNTLPTMPGVAAGAANAASTPGVAPVINEALGTNLSGPAATPAAPVSVAQPMLPPASPTPVAAPSM